MISCLIPFIPFPSGAVYLTDLNLISNRFVPMSKKENLEWHAYEFSTVLVNSLCFDLSFAKGGFINLAKSVGENAQAIFLALGVH